jgi:predicted ester cyclase
LEENKAVVQRLFGAINSGNLDELQGFPDLHLTTEELIAEGDQVVGLPGAPGADAAAVRE